MWFVRLSLRRPYTFVVIALLIFIFGFAFTIQAPKDALPNINVPVISVIWSYEGLTASDVEKSVTTFSEISMSTTVNGIERIESQSLNGTAMIRVYLYPDADVASAISEITAVSQAILHKIPNHIFPPFILLYTPSSVPIIQLVLTSDTMSDQDLYNYADVLMRDKIFEIRGITLPSPYGGKLRQMMVDVDPDALQARGLSPRDINKVMLDQSLVLATGDARIGDIDYVVNANAYPQDPDEYNNYPVASIDGVVVFLRDVAHAHNGFPPQVNSVHKMGQRAVLQTVLKNGNNSIPKIIDSLKDIMPEIRASAPKDVEISLLFDQSVFVNAAVKNVAIEGLMAATLTGLLMFLFLGSWRSTIIVVISIPLAALGTIIIISIMGYSLNLMTLGGLALSTGILVDNATVTLENVHRHLDLGKPLRESILIGSQEIALPSFVSTMAICIVFLPVMILVGPSRFLFIPFAISVVIAIALSYFIARTLVPVMIDYMFKHEQDKKKENLVEKFHKKFEKGFERFRNGYSRLLDACLKHRAMTCTISVLVFSSSFILVPFIGIEFFPTVDANQLRLHVKAPTGTRIEVTEQIFAKVEEEITKLIPKHEITTIINDIGINPNFYNMAYGDNATIGFWDGEILIAFNPNKSKSTSEYMDLLRNHLYKKFPQYVFFFQSADLISQTLNFGLPTPIDVQIVGHGHNNWELAQELLEKISHVPGAVDVHIHQDIASPELFLNFDRVLLSQLNLTAKDIMNDILISFSNSVIVSPNYWLDPVMRLGYPITVQTPQYRTPSLEALLNTPISSPNSKSSPLLRNLAKVERRITPAAINHVNVQPVFDVYANVHGISVGKVAKNIQKVIDSLKPKLEPANHIEIRGMVRDMQSTYFRLGIGFICAIILIYFILVINFQSWLDPFIIINALLGATAGVLWIFFLTNTSFSVPAIMGAIVSMGVATANSILVVSFANTQLLEGKSSLEASHTAGLVRLRPVLMTALAMFFGMMPMALSLGTGGKQNAPLGIAVIGGLVLATLTTLIFVPVIFSIFRKVPNAYLAEEPKK